MKFIKWLVHRKRRIIFGLGLMVILLSVFTWQTRAKSIYPETSIDNASKQYLQGTNDTENLFQQAAIDLLYKQFDLAEIDHSMTVTDIVILDTSARVDILLTTTGSELGKIEDLIHIYILHNGSQIQQIFREPSPEFHQFAEQISPELLPPERLNFWQDLLTIQQLTGIDQPTANLYKLPFTGNTRHTVYQDFNKHFDFAGDGWLVRAALGGIAKNGVDTNGAYYTRVLHADGTYGWYLHFQTNSWVTGTNGSTYNVAQGDCLGYSGDTGYTFGAHLHFNVSTTFDNSAGCDIQTGCNPPNWLAVNFVEGTIPTGGVYTPYSQNSTVACGAGCCGCTTTTQTPTYNTAFLTDAELTAYNSMSVQDIRNFLTVHNSYFKNPVVDVDSVTIDLADVIVQAASTHQISPKVLLTTLQKESSGVTTATRPSNMGWIMGYGSPSTARDQVDKAAQAFRWYHNTIQSTGQTPTGWKVGVGKQTLDGVTVAPATNAIAGQFTYTPHAGTGWGGSSDGGVNLFYQIWNNFGFDSGLAYNNTLSMFGLTGLENNAFTPLPSPSEIEPALTLERVLFEDLAPAWPATFESVITTTNEPLPPNLSWPEAVDETGEVVAYLVYWGDDPQGSAETSISSTSITPSEKLNPADGPTIRYLRVAAQDDTGNISEWHTTAVWRYDPISPTGTLVVDSGSNVVNTLNVHLTLVAEDEGSQITQMRFSNDEQTWTEWEPFADQRVWQLNETEQPQTIYAQVQDEAGNISETMNTTVTAELTLLPPTSTNYALSCRTFGMGGGSKSSASFTVNSTTGQSHETGLMQSGSYQVNSGYWSACGSTNTAPPTGSPIRISLASQTIALSEGEFCVDVTTADVTDLGSFEFELSFPPALLQVTQASLGAFLTSTGRTSIPLGPTINNTTGSINFGAGTVGSQAGPNGSGTLANICFTPQQAGTATLDFTTGQLTDTSGSVINSYLADGTVTIQGSNCYWADLDCDNDVDVVDIQKVAGRWGTQIGDVGYSAFYDLDDDGDIDIVDVQLVASQWNWPNQVNQINGLAANSPITLSLTPEMLDLSPGETRQIALNVAAVNLAAYEINLSFNPVHLQVTDVIFTDFLSSTGRTAVTVGSNINNLIGQVNFGAATFGAPVGVSGDDVLAYIEVTALSAGDGTLNLYDSQATEPDATSIQVIEADADYWIGYHVFLPATIK
ncbi:MAG: peptidoglycan DD-metalloendopeptidase family protein [Anaerolineae bacterium]|nr:peptidoglycan DD-metalloendopeptidase family protein [Anaerolineae bacterium]